MCCPRGDCPLADGRSTRNSRGRRFGGEVPARGGCGGGGNLALPGRREERKGGEAKSGVWFFWEDRRVGEQRAGVGGGFCRRVAEDPVTRGEWRQFKLAGSGFSITLGSVVWPMWSCRCADGNWVVSAESQFSGAIGVRGQVDRGRSCRVRARKMSGADIGSRGQLLADAGLFSCWQSHGIMESWFGRLVRVECVWNALTIRSQRFWLPVIFRCSEAASVIWMSSGCHLTRCRIFGLLGAVGCSGMQLNAGRQGMQVGWKNGEER